MTDDRAKEVLAEALGVSISSIPDDAAMDTYYPWDSLSHVRVILALEKAFGIEISDDSVLEYASLSRLRELAKSRVDEPRLLGVDERTVLIESFDGAILGGTLRHPSRVSGAALLVHGMTADREEWGLYTSLADSLASRGIASLRFDLRCHGSATTLSTKSLSLFGIMNDIDAAYAVLAAAVGREVPTAIIGASFGAGVSAHWAHTHRPRIRIAVLCYPVLDYVADLDRSCDAWRKQLDGSESALYAGRALSRPIFNEAPYVAGLSLAGTALSIAIFHGDADSDVPIAKSREFVRHISTAKLFELRGFDHGFAQPGDLNGESDVSARNRSQAVMAISDLLATSLSA